MSTISSTITHGITLGTTGTYASPLTITATGSVSNNGTSDTIYGPGPATWIVDNDGQITATGSFDAIDLKNGGSVANGSTGAATALIMGGAGGAGGAGGIGVSLSGGGSVSNTGTIGGGGGGYGSAGIGYYYGGPGVTPGGNGGAGGIGINLSGVGYVENAGRVSGGAGGNGGVGEVGSGSGGAGGTGINLADGGRIANAGAIFGGSGAAGGTVLHYSYGGHGAGADAIDLGGGGSIVNTGTIAGGYGGWSGGRGGGFFAPAGAGISLAEGGNITNGSPVATASLIDGGGGIWAFGGAGATIINYGIILDIVRYDPSGGVNLFAGGLVSNQVGGVIANNGPYGTACSSPGRWARRRPSSIRGVSRVTSGSRSTQRIPAATRSSITAQ